MTGKRRRLWILVLWTTALVAFAWLFIPRPAWGDDEYFKWFIFGMLAFGPRWFLDFLVVLLVGFSLERRRGLRRLYILCVWALITAGAVWLNVLRPTIPPCSPYEHSLRLRASVHRSEEHTSELQSQSNLVCRLLLEKKKQHSQCLSWPSNAYFQYL